MHKEYNKNKRNNAKKSEQLGMSYGKARNILNKNIMFTLMKNCGMDDCFQCGEKIMTVDEISVEHKRPWLDTEDPVDLFFNLDNIAFSHFKCNVGTTRKPPAKPKPPKKLYSQKIGVSGYKGVGVASGKKSKYKYMAKLNYQGKKIHIASGDDARELAIMYDKMAIKYLGKDAITNKMLGLL